MDVVEGVLLGSAVAGGVVAVEELRRHHVGGPIARAGTAAAEQAGRLTKGAGELAGSMLDWSSKAVRKTSELAGKGVTATGRTVASTTGKLLGAEQAVPPAAEPAKQPAAAGKRRTSRRRPVAVAS